MVGWILIGKLLLRLLIMGFNRYRSPQEVIGNRAYSSHVP